MRFIIRWFITTMAVAVAAWVTPGIIREGSWWLAAMLTAFILGFINALIRPILKLLSCGMLILTLGLFTLVINALCLWLASWLSVTFFGLGFQLTSPLSAIIGSIIISVVSFFLSFLLPDRPKIHRMDGTPQRPQ